MSRDIRSYFSFGAAKGHTSRISDDESPKGKVNGKSEKAPKKKKTIIIDSDDEEDRIPPPKRKKMTNTSVNKRESTKTSVQKLKPVNISDVFGKKPVLRTDTILQKNKVADSSPVKEEMKGNQRPAKVVEAIFDSSSEDDFLTGSRSASDKVRKNRERAVEKAPSEGVKEAFLHVGISPKEEELKGVQQLVQKVECLSDSSSEGEKSSCKAVGKPFDKREKSLGQEARPMQHTSPKKGKTKVAQRPARMADYLSESSSDDDTAKGSVSKTELSLGKGGVTTNVELRKAEEKREMGEATSRCSNDGDASKSHSGQGKKHIKAEQFGTRSPKVTEKGSPVPRGSPHKSPLERKVDSHKGKEVSRDHNITPKQKKRTARPETPGKGTEEEGHGSASKGDGLNESEKKKQRAIQYQRYLHREGPRNHGSKEIPKGNPNSLLGLTFVITEVLESLDRDEAASLVQQCGGKVTSNISKNTSYIVLGDDPGPSKLEKARRFGTKELTEDGLLDLVRAKTKEIEGETPCPSVGDRSSKRTEEDDGSELRSSAAKRRKMNVEEHGDEKKPGLAKKLAFMSQNYGLPLSNVAKGAQAATVKLEKSGSLKPKAQVDGSCSETSSTASQVKSEEAMWVDRYKPTCLKQVIGQQGEKSNVNKLLRWLSNWHRYHGPHGKRPPRPGPWDKNDDGGFFKAALLSGPPGVGKTTSALLVCKELGMDAVELNASDTRSKKLLESEVAELIVSNSLSGYFKAGKKDEGKKKVLVMDEVDGMAGNEDRGGVAALMQLIKDSRIPIICICNDRAHPKIRSLVNHCYDLRFQRPRMEQIRGAMMSICFKEGVKVTPDALANLITSTNQDIRQVLHQLNMWSADKNISAKTGDSPSNKRKDTLKDVRLGPWDVLRKVFSAEERRNTTINQQSELFFYDYNLGPLFVFENYPKVSPKSARNLKERLSLLAQTTESLAMGDIIQKSIRQNNAWKLLPAQAIFSSVLPGALMEGHMTGQIEFPAFLGKTSTKGKMERLAQEISLHTRVTTRATKQSIKMDYLTYLKDAIVSPLVKESQDQNRGEGSGAHIKEALEVMQGYNLLREDLDSIMELTNFPGQPDPMAKVSTKVKAAFTRAYNKEGIMTPYAVTMAVKKKRGGGSSDDFYGEEGEGEEGTEDAEVEEQEEDIDADAMIKIKKPSARGGQGSSKGGDSGKGGGKDVGTDGGKGKGRGKGASGGGRGGKKRS